MRHNLFLLLAVSLLAIAAPQSCHAREYVVQMITRTGSKHPFRFSPSKLTIHKGDTVRFVNAQDDRHDVMFETVPKGADFAMSPMLEKKGQSWTYTFDREGTYEYHCHPHEALGMHGTIVVGHASKAADLKKDLHHHHDD